jgi:hypothetical protein
VWAVAAIVAAFPGDAGTGPWPAVTGGVETTRVIARWDSAWYLHLSEVGYPDLPTTRTSLRSIAFFPLLPTLIGGVSRMTGLSPLAAGILITTVVGGGAVVLVWQLVDDLAGRAAADRAAVLLCLFPGSFALSMVYAEGLLVAAVAVCLRGLHRGRWLMAGAAAAVAGLARPNGMAAVVACAAAVVSAVVTRREWKAAWAVAIAPLGVLGYLGFLSIRTGEPLIWFRSQHEGWNDHIDLGAAALERLRVMVTEPHASLAGTQLNDLVGAVGLVVLAVSLMLLVRWRPPSPVICYTVVAVAMAVASEHVGPRPRMLLAAFPLIVATAVATQGRVYRVITVACGVLLVAVTALTFATRAATP